MNFKFSGLSFFFLKVIVLEFGFSLFDGRFSTISVSLSELSSKEFQGVELKHIENRDSDKPSLFSMVLNLSERRKITDVAIAEVIEKSSVGSLLFEVEPS